MSEPKHSAKRADSLTSRALIRMAEDASEAHGVPLSELAMWFHETPKRVEFWFAPTPHEGASPSAGEAP